uniref:Uncharacterized protein n=1 Tax=Kwoniella bestiolae CBS 10118 TaxID=1296100 RepID=A0A1B9FVT9_9TREE|nr:hypothetical protein I302_07217 [Kwoniella bestiolae CBS 10118]OCF22870.1 hypothetical protein I302_07217 [Kwoniella bestiolae CBS 10118]
MIEATRSCLAQTLSRGASSPSHAKGNDELTNNYLTRVDDYGLSDVDWIAYPCQKILNEGVERERASIKDAGLLQWWDEQKKDGLYKDVDEATRIFLDFEKKIGTSGGRMSG